MRNKNHIGEGNGGLSFCGRPSGWEDRCEWDDIPRRFWAEAMDPHGAGHWYCKDCLRKIAQIHRVRLGKV